MVLLLLAGCGGALECGVGTEAVGGTCIVDDDSHTADTDSAEEPLVAVWGVNCDLEPENAWSAVEGCVHDVCVDDDLALIQSVLGPPDSCINGLCEWGGIVANFGLGSTPNDDDRASSLLLVPPFSGVSIEGLNLGDDLRCFVAALGEPDSAALSSNGQWVFSELIYQTAGIHVFGDEGQEHISHSVLLSGVDMR